MRSFSDVNVLITLMLVVAVCAMVNLNTTIALLEWTYEGLASLTHHLMFFFGGIIWGARV